MFTFNLGDVDIDPEQLGNLENFQLQIPTDGEMGDMNIADIMPQLEAFGGGNFGE